MFLNFYIVKKIVQAKKDFFIRFNFVFFYQIRRVLSLKIYLLSFLEYLLDVFR
jgi:hypothetical protein